jgi:hypothetical protein
MKFRSSMVLFLVLSFSAFAQSPEAVRVEPAPNDPHQEEHIQRLAQEYGISAEVIEQAREAGIGIGEIDVLVDMSKAANKPVTDIIAARQRGQTWSAIAADHDLRLETVIRDEDVRNAVLQGDRNLGRQIADEFGISETAAAAYRARLAEWGEVKLALGLSKRSGVPVEQIIARAEKGEGWGDIAASMNLVPGTIMEGTDDGAMTSSTSTPRERLTKD